MRQTDRASAQGTWAKGWFLLTVLTYLLVPWWSMSAFAQADPSPAGTLTIEASDDVFVVKLIASNRKVQSGDVLMVLTSPMLTYWQSLLAEQQRELDIKARSASDGRNAERLQYLEAKADALRQASQAQSDIYDIRNQQRSMIGTVELSSLKQTTFDAENAQSTYLDAKFTADQEPRRQQDEKDKLASERAKLAEQQALFQDLSSRLTVRSTVAGNFQSVVAEGMFVKKGHRLGTIVPESAAGAVALPSSNRPAALLTVPSRGKAQALVIPQSTPDSGALPTYEQVCNSTMRSAAPESACSSQLSYLIANLQPSTTQPVIDVPNPWANLGPPCAFCYRESPFEPNPAQDLPTQQELWKITDEVLAPILQDEPVLVPLFD
jgi:biotin carboxyl carrier protein